jgi:hydroxyethylthiazole kinase-like uncharacterized protein yjeF
MPMSTDHDAENTPAEKVDAASLRRWSLPEPGSSKRSRGDVLVVGGALRSPGAVELAGLAALRVGAGRLTLAVGSSVAAALAVAVPESGVVPLGEVDEHVDGASVDVLDDDLESAQAVLAGPGLDDPDSAAAIVRHLAEHTGDDTIVVLDAYALGVLPGAEDAIDALRGRLILTPNDAETERLLGRETGDRDEDLTEVAHRYGAVVSNMGSIVAADGRRWSVQTGGPGLGTSGSGDVLAGAIAGLAARGATPAQAAVWGTFLHARSGDRLAESIAPLGFLARELLDELPRVLGDTSD